GRPADPLFDVLRPPPERRTEPGDGVPHRGAVRKERIPMTEPHNLFGTLQEFTTGEGRTGKLYSLPYLDTAGVGPVSRLPVSIRIVLESVLRNCDRKRIQEADVRALANWKPNAERTGEIPFVVARIVLQDLTGVPLLVDL